MLKQIKNLTKPVNRPPQHVTLFAVQINRQAAPAVAGRRYAIFKERV